MRNPIVQNLQDTVYTKISEKDIFRHDVERYESKTRSCTVWQPKRSKHQHYLIKMIQKILSSIENYSKGDIFAVIAPLVDWKQAFSRQDPTLGIQSFIENTRIRPSLLPMLANYFQDRKAFVKWKGNNSETKDSHGGGTPGWPLWHI